MFDPDFVNGMFDALICYLEAEGVGHYEVKEREGWKIVLDRRRSIGRRVDC